MYGRDYAAQPMQPMQAMPQGYGDQRYMPQGNPYERRLGAIENDMRRPPQQNVNWIPVNGYEDVRGIMVQPGMTVWAMDNNEPVFYVKTADQMGVCTIDAYRYERVQVGANQQTAPAGEYITRQEYQSLIERIERMENGGVKYGKSADKQNRGANINADAGE